MRGRRTKARGREEAQEEGGQWEGEGDEALLMMGPLSLSGLLQHRTKTQM